MNRRASLLISGALLVLLVSGVAQEEAPDPPPTWQDVIAGGLLPYRQLVVADFPINDSAHPQHGFHIKAGFEPRYHFRLKPHPNGFVYAYVDQWLIFSGLNTRETWRKSTFKNMKAELPYAQAILDLNEISARQIAALKTGELPQGRGASFEAARADMEMKIKVLLEAKYRHAHAEIDAFVKATDHGNNKKKVQKLAADIRKRLDATPATTVQANATAPSSASPTPSASASPAASPRSTPAPRSL